MTNAYTTFNPSLNTEIIGSEFPVAVYPSLVDPTRCYSDVPSSDTLKLTANVAYNFKINFVDIYGNLHYQTMTDDALNVVVKADLVW